MRFGGFGAFFLLLYLHWADYLLIFGTWLILFGFFALFFFGRQWDAGKRGFLEEMLSSCASFSWSLLGFSSRFSESWFIVFGLFWWTLPLDLLSGKIEPVLKYADLWTPVLGWILDLWWVWRVFGVLLKLVHSLWLILVNPPFRSS